MSLFEKIIFLKRLSFLKFRCAHVEHIYFPQTGSREHIELCLTYCSFRDAYGFDGSLGFIKCILKKSNLCVSEHITDVYNLENGLKKRVTKTFYKQVFKESRAVNIYTAHSYRMIQNKHIRKALLLSLCNKCQNQRTEKAKTCPK